MPKQPTVRASPIGLKPCFHNARAPPSFFRASQANYTLGAVLNATASTAARISEAFDLER